MLLGLLAAHRAASASAAAPPAQVLLLAAARAAWAPSSSLSPVVVTQRARAVGLKGPAPQQRQSSSRSYAHVGKPKGATDTRALRRSLLEAAAERGGGSGSGGLRGVLRAFARKHVVVMTHEELQEFELLLGHEDELLWRWLEQPERTPAWVAANSTFGLLQQFAGYWCREGREYS